MFLTVQEGSEFPGPQTNIRVNKWVKQRANIFLPLLKQGGRRLLTQNTHQQNTPPA